MSTGIIFRGAQYVSATATKETHGLQATGGEGSKSRKLLIHFTQKFGTNLTVNVKTACLIIK